MILSGGKRSIEVLGGGRVLFTNRGGVLLGGLTQICRVAEGRSLEGDGAEHIYVI